MGGEQTSDAAAPNPVADDRVGTEANSNKAGFWRWLFWRSDGCEKKEEKMVRWGKLSNGDSPSSSYQTNYNQEWHKRFEEMKEKGQSPGEIWGTFWEETHFGSQRGPWGRMQQQWEDMKKQGKSPNEFWETVQVKEESNHTENWKRQCEQWKKEGKSPDELWGRHWEESQFGSHGGPWVAMQKKWEHMRKEGKSPKEFWEKINKEDEQGPWSEKWKEEITDMQKKGRSAEEMWETFWGKSHFGSHDLPWVFMQKGDGNGKTKHIKDNEVSDNTNIKNSGSSRYDRSEWQKRFEEMKKKDKSPGEIWGTFWEETQFGSHDGTWGRMKETWDEMRKQGKSPKEFWDTVKIDKNQDSNSIHNDWRNKCEQLKKDGKPPDELWGRYWEESQFGSHGGPWVAMQKKWEHMKKEGKSPKDFWEEINKEDEQGPWSEKWKEEITDMQRKGRSAEEMWKTFWGKSHFGSHDLPWVVMNREQEEGDNPTCDVSEEIKDGVSKKTFKWPTWKMSRRPIPKQTDGDNIPNTDTPGPRWVGWEREHKKWHGMGRRLWGKREFGEERSRFYEEFDFIN